MGFVYEVMPIEEANVIDVDRLRSLSGNVNIGSKAWCIDRERNAVFLRVHRIGRYTSALPERFALVLSGSVIWIELFMVGYEKTPWKKITWALERLGVPAEVKAPRDEVLELIRGAVGVWTPHAWKLPWLAHEDMVVVCQF